MSSNPRRPYRFPLSAALALPTIIAVAAFAEGLLTGAGQSWTVVLWREVVYWCAWVVLIPPIFWLCGWLYAGPSRWWRYTLGMLAGTGFTVVALPLAYELVRFGGWSAGWALGWAAQQPPPYWGEFRGLFPHLITAAVALFACTVVPWFAVMHYRDARERRVEAAQLGAMLQKAQLQALRSQLNPHFLFNTLHSIAELIHENPALAEQMLLKLGELLRKSLHAPSLEVPLSEELEFIRDYLAIEQMRLGDRLQVAWSIEPAALEVPVPSLILQPIVENAIQHGIGQATGPGKLEITAAVSDDQLRLEVRDNGPGLTADLDATRAGIGLENTRERLNRLYGTRATFQLTNDRGLVVSMAWPCVG